MHRLKCNKESKDNGALMYSYVCQERSKIKVAPTPEETFLLSLMGRTEKVAFTEFSKNLQH